MVSLYFVRLNEEQEQQLSELTQRANDSVVSTEEHQRLLEQLQSEKATISRALTQNKQLKQQLEEMHDGFIKLVSLNVPRAVVRWDCVSPICRCHVFFAYYCFVCKTMVLL